MSTEPTMTIAPTTGWSRLAWRLTNAPTFQLSVIILATTWLYLPTFSRYFVSEDFVLLSLFETKPFLAVLWEHISGPWLGLTVLPFYRPFSTLLLQIEHLAFGVEPFGYQLVHYAVHLMNTALVYQIGARLAGRVGAPAAFIGAAVFALYPLHPNAVVFIGAFATLFCATFVLLACLAHLWAIRTGSPRATASTVLLLTLALGCYEQAAMAPALLLIQDLLGFAAGRWTLRLRFWLIHQAAVWTTVITYLTLRRLALGDAVAGYSGWVERLMDQGLLELLTMVLGWIPLLVYPSYAEPIASVTTLWLISLGLILTLIALTTLRRFEAAYWWLLGLSWILIAQSPFMFAAVVPATGRYWYLSSVGLAFILVALVFSVPRRPFSGRASLTTMVLLTLGIAWYPLQRLNIDASAQAGELSRRVQLEIGAMDVPKNAVVFVSGIPAFVFGPGPVRMAQVYQWGLSNATSPPFAPAHARVYVLHSLEMADFSPLSAVAESGGIWLWEDGKFRLRPFEDTGPPRQSIEISTSRSPTDGASDAYRFRGSPGLDYRLVIATQASVWTFDIQGPATTKESAPVLLPPTLIQSMHGLYPTPIFWWIEGRQDDRVHGISALNTLMPR